MTTQFQTQTVLMDSGSLPLIELQQITKSYFLAETEIPVLKGIDLTIEVGDYVAIMGTSGSGKSTLMNIIGCLDRPSSGFYRLLGHDLAEFTDAELAGIRNQQIGFVFQQFNLLPRSTALENVMLPLIYAGVPRSERMERAMQALTAVGLQDRTLNRPHQLSGGQQQRVAMARALINQPNLVLADEPTGALDSQTSHEIMNLLEELNHQGITIMMVTHEAEVAKRARRVIRMQDGLIIENQTPSLKD